MPNNKSLQFFRGTSAQRKASSDKLLPGQPFYETDTNLLYVGNGGYLRQLTPLGSDPLELCVFNILDSRTSDHKLYQGWVIAPITHNSTLPDYLPVVNGKVTHGVGMLSIPKGPNELQTSAILLVSQGDRAIPLWSLSTCNGLWDSSDDDIDRQPATILQFFGNTPGITTKVLYRTLIY